MCSSAQEVKIVNKNLENFKNLANFIDLSGGVETSGLKDLSKIDFFC